MDRILQYLLVEVPEASLMLLIGMALYNQNAFSDKKRVFIYTLALSLESAILSDFGAIYEVRLTCFFITSSILLNLIYKKSLLSSIGTMALTFVIQIIAETTIITVFNEFGMFFENITENVFTRFGAAYLYLLLLFLIFLILRKLKIDIAKIIPKEVRNRYLILLIILMSIELLLILFVNANYFLGKEGNISHTLFQQHKQWLVFVLMLALFIGIAGTFYIYLKTTILHVQLETETPYVRNINDFVTKLRAVRHDAINHIAVIQHLIQEKQVAEAYDYADQVVQETNEVVQMVKEVNNLAASAIIQSKKETCKIKDIEFDISVDSKWQLKHLKTIDLVTIFGNLLDNAIEANRDTPLKNKYVKISWCETSDCEILTFENTGKAISSDNINKVFQLGFTTKENGSGGTGLAMVKQIIEKHKGAIVVESSNVNTTFTISLPKTSLKPSA